LHEPISLPERFRLVSQAATLQAICKDAGLQRRRGLARRMLQMLRTWAALITAPPLPI
jgi:hypothetical protein